MQRCSRMFSLPHFLCSSRLPLLGLLLTSSAVLPLSAFASDSVLSLASPFRPPLLLHSPLLPLRHVDFLLLFFRSFPQRSQADSSSSSHSRISHISRSSHNK